MPTLAEAIKDKKGFPDDAKVPFGNGLDMTWGEFRAYQEASGQDLAKSLDAERKKMEAERQELSKAQEEVVNLWTALQTKKEPTPSKREESADLFADPFFAPVAKYLRDTIESRLTSQEDERKKQADQIAQFQKALGLGVKYIADVISEQRYQMLPEDFRKENAYNDAIRVATERKLLDAGGVPDVRKVYDEWRAPREKKAFEERVQKEAYDKARADLMATSLARPSGVPSGGPSADPNAPKTLRESFSRLKEDPEFLAQVYNLTGKSGGGQA